MKNNFREAALGIIDVSGYSDYEISKMTGIRTSSISRWRTERTHPRKNSLRILAAALNTTVRFYTDGITESAEFQEPQSAPEVRKDLPPLRQESHPVYTWSHAMTEDFFNSTGIPQGDPVHQLAALGEISDPTTFALILDVQKNTQVDPFFRFGDVLIISPTATVRNGDHVLIRLNSGEMYARKALLQGDDILLLDTNSSTSTKVNSLAVNFYHKIIYVRKR